MVLLAMRTCGGGHGAAARAACWRYLFGHVTAWVDVEPQQSKEDAPQVPCCPRHRPGMGSLAVLLCPYKSMTMQRNALSS